MPAVGLEPHPAERLAPRRALRAQRLQPLRRGRRCACAAPRRPCAPRPPPAPAACRRARWRAPRRRARSSFARLVGGEVAGIAAQHAAVELDDARRDGVEEGAVVGDRRMTLPREATEQLLEPGDRVEVEVVGRLVEQQHVGHGDQRLRQRDALLACRPTARRSCARRRGAVAPASSRRAAPSSRRRAPRSGSAGRRGRRLRRAPRSARAPRAPRRRPRRPRRTRSPPASNAGSCGT